MISHLLWSGGTMIVISGRILEDFSQKNVCFERGANYILWRVDFFRKYITFPLRLEPCLTSWHIRFLVVVMYTSLAHHSDETSCLIDLSFWWDKVSDWIISLMRQDISLDRHSDETRFLIGSSFWWVKTSDRRSDEKRHLIGSSFWWDKTSD
jgi:hypothetical protein